MRVFARIFALIMTIMICWIIMLALVWVGVELFRLMF